MERQLTFIDVDENRLELRLKQDRVQLVVIDSRPELEAGELRRFASVVFAEYVARDLTARLDEARRRLREVRDRTGGDELAAALDGALRSIDELAAAVVVPEPLPEPALVEDDAEPDVAAAPEPAPVPIVLPSLAGRRPYPLLSRRKTTRGTPAREGAAPGWTGGDAATSSSCRPR